MPLGPRGRRRPAGGVGAARGAACGGRRGMLGGLAALLAGGAARARAAAEPSPAALAGQEPMGLDRQGRVRPCPNSLGSNCVSTSSRSDLYAPPWRAPARLASATAVADEVAAAVARELPDALLLERSLAADGESEYLRWGLRGRSGQDSLEFLCRPPRPPDRGWAGDTEGAMVFYRSAAGGARFIWPVTEPLSEGGAQRQRAEALREALGWQLVGCELAECYSIVP